MNKKLRMFKERNLKNYGETSTTVKTAKRFLVPFVTFCILSFNYYIFQF